MKKEIKVYNIRKTDPDTAEVFSSQPYESSNSSPK